MAAPPTNRRLEIVQVPAAEYCQVLSGHLFGIKLIYGEEGEGEEEVSPRHGLY